MSRRLRQAKDTLSGSASIASRGRVLAVASLIALFTSCGDEQRPTAPRDGSEGLPEGGVAARVLIDTVADSIKARSRAGGTDDATLTLRGAIVLSAPSANVVAADPLATATVIPFEPIGALASRLGPACDDCVMTDVAIGFPFTFFGNTYESLDISSNGFVRFGTPPSRNQSGCCAGRVIPQFDGGPLDNLIAIAWTDWTPLQQGMIRYETRGASPNRRFVVQFVNVPECCDPNTTIRLTAQLVLFEGTSVAELHVTSQGNRGRVVTQGIENQTGTLAAFVPGRVATPFSLSNSAVRFTTVRLNTAPSVSIGDRYEAAEGSAIEFSGTAADPDGDALAYAWDFEGDGTTDATTASASHVYLDDGDYTARLTVNDGRGGVVVASAPVHVTNVAPSVVTGSDLVVQTGNAVSIDASFDDPGLRDGDWRYSVLWGDDASDAGTSSGALRNQGHFPISHTYRAPGVYRVTVKVVDKDLAEGTSTLTVTVDNRAPVADAGTKYVGAEGQAVQFDATASSDADGDALAYAWDFGDGSPVAEGAKPSHVYTDDGSFVARLTVTDGRGGTAEATVPVQIANQNPTAAFAAPASVTVGSPIVLGVSNATDPGSADRGSLQVSFDCGSGFAVSAVCPTTSVGTRSVYGRVSDKDGGSTTYGPFQVAVQLAGTSMVVANALADYGDPATLSVSLSSNAGPSAGSPTGTMEFLVNGASVGSVPVLGTGTVTLPALAGGRLPGSYAVTAIYTATPGGNFLGGAVGGTLQVVRENLAAQYTGDLFVQTAGPTATSASVRLAASLAQDADGHPSDITTARVRFELYRSANAGNTPDQVVDNVPVDATGSALTSLSLASDSWTVKVMVPAGNAYWVGNPVGIGTFTVAVGGDGQYVTGGGWVADAASPNGKNSFSFTVSTSTTGEPRGNAHYVFRGADGYDYRVRATSWEAGGLTFYADPGAASFVGRSSVQKIDPATGRTIATASGYTLTMDLIDGAEDRVAITVRDASDAVWRQVGTRAAPAVVLDGGNVTVHGR